MIIKELEQLKDLDIYKQAVFAYLTCERLFPNYVYFYKNYDFGNYIVLRESIDYIYGNIFESNPDYNEIQNLINKVEINTPNTEDYSVIFVSSACDACNSIMDTLEFLTTKDFSKIQDVSSYGIDTVDMYIRSIENLNYNTNINIESKVDNHPLMMSEISIQTGIINYLNRSTLDYEDIQTLIQLQENKKRSSLDL